MKSSTPGVNILIVTALAEELEALQGYFATGDIQHTEHSSLIYYQFQVNSLCNDNSYTVAVICLFDMGNLSSGIETTKAIQELKPDYVIMFGIAGGIRNRVDLGDVIVATKIYYYEQAKLKPNEQEIRPQSIPTDPFLRKKLEHFSSQVQKPYAIHFGPLAAGEKVVSDSKVVESLQQREPKLLGIEMESFGVALASSMDFLRPRFIAIRGVSDCADELKDDNHRQRALNYAADFLLSFLQTGALSSSNLVSNEKKNTLIAIHHVSLDHRPSLQNSISKKIPHLKDYSIVELEINQSEFYDDGKLTNPVNAYAQQLDFGKRLDNLIDEHPDASIGYFALAHIPFMFQLGYETNIREVQVFATDRQTRHWEALSSEIKPWSEIKTENLPDQIDTDITEVVLRMSISYPVLLEQITDTIDISSKPLLHLAVDRPSPDLIRYESQLDNYAQTFHQILTEINRFFPKVRVLHIFYSGPPTLAFRCGQQINKTIDPEVVIYNFSKKDTPYYGWCLNIQNREIIDFREQ